MFNFVLSKNLPSNDIVVLIHSATRRREIWHINGFQN